MRRHVTIYICKFTLHIIAFHPLTNIYFTDFAASTSLSKSTAQTLARPSVNPLANPDEITPQNKIVPLTTIPNAPFEQTFRITIYLPHGQLYVARIGAKTKLCELLNTICANKSLDSNKFEFKHPSELKKPYLLINLVQRN